jgi:hypothetical protein
VLRDIWSPSIQLIAAAQHWKCFYPLLMENLWERTKIAIIGHYLRSSSVNRYTTVCGTHTAFVDMVS